MQNYDIYNDIAKRTGGDIYLGVVGPVRTGKSTFIKKFMELMVLDKIEDKNKRARAVDELPQSADGKTIMTTEPKFVPNEAVTLTLDDDIMARVRLIDCVGYLIDDAIGHKEGDKARMVRTPWSENELPFQQAAELGTNKVIREHSTIGIVVTTDGSITGIGRSKYILAEERVINELKAIGKPFAVILNTVDALNADTIKLKESLEDRYGVPVIAINVATMNKEELAMIMANILLEFPLRKIDIRLPKWMRALNSSHRIIKQILGMLTKELQNVKKMRDYKRLKDVFAECEWLEREAEIIVDSASGTVNMNCFAPEGLYFKVLSEECGNDVDDDFKLLAYVKKLAGSYKEYEGIRKAMERVRETGYGVINPEIEDMQLEEPEVLRRGPQFGIKLKASAPSLHIIRVDVETEISPIIGSQQQSEDLVNYMLGEFENNKKGIWETNMFGKSLNSLVKEDLTNKLNNMPVDAQNKLRKTMCRIVNEGRGGVLCILL
ncbi:MAG: stage IV sporulation protein A [Clostridia bacterium]|nr:stage IV sporulation protein A [Clostridia bacterium]